MYKYLKEQIKRIPNYVLILTGIILLGIFLRTYHFHDWLRFNADQSRDAGVVSDFVEGKSGLPLLGPKAGGTEFKLGGAFYYLQITSAKIFGDAPDKMAYPDLLASILAIPLLFLFLKRAFNENIALVLTGVLSVSIFAIKYARFAWNPNSAPFYCLLFLYALLVLGENKTVRKFWWALAGGVALGVGVQLHTLLLIIMPITAVIFFVWVSRKNPLIWKQAAIVFLLAAFLNTGQIVSEFQTNGANVKAFFGGASTKTAKGSSLLNNLADDVACQLQADVFIISGLGNDDQCGAGLLKSIYNKTQGIFNKAFFVFGTFLSLVFSFGGVWLWLQSLRKTTEPKKKLFLQLAGIYALVGFILLIPLAKEISLRFYLALIFVPFVLLSLWLEALLQWGEKYSKYAMTLVGIIVVIILGTNILAVKTSFADHANKKQISTSTETEIMLGEAEFLANYVVQHAQPGSTVFLQGKQTYLFKYLKSIEYFTSKHSVQLKAFSKKTEPSPSDLIFSISNAKNKGKLTKSFAEIYVAQDIKSHGRFTIEELIKK